MDGGRKTGRSSGCFRIVGVRDGVRMADSGNLFFVKYFEE
jgi:hypothetical protein